MEYVIYADESVSKGYYFSNFYGGALVRSVDLEDVAHRLESAKKNARFKGEVKWSKVTEQYLEKYEQLVNVLFDLISKDKIKIRIMFTHEYLRPSRLTRDQKENQFHLLYYQFIKHAFGLRYHDGPRPVGLRIYFDRLPDKKEKNDNFKR